MAEKHTAGPWKAHTSSPEQGLSQYVTAGLNDQIYIAQTGRWDLASAADARLIAAAPELLRVCQMWVILAESNFSDSATALQAIKASTKAAIRTATQAAITQATGKSRGGE